MEPFRIGGHLLLAAQALDGEGADRGPVFCCTRCGDYAAGRSGQSLTQKCPGQSPNAQRTLQLRHFEHGRYPARGPHHGWWLGPRRGLCSEEQRQLAQRHGYAAAAASSSSAGAAQAPAAGSGASASLSRAELLLRFGVTQEDEEHIRHTAKVLHSQRAQTDAEHAFECWEPWEAAASADETEDAQ